jgi:hypothetical protein
MSGAVTVAVITLFLAFVAGLRTGRAMVIAASVRRADKAHRRNRQVDEEPPYHPDDWPDGDGPAGPPRWPTQGS